VPETIAASDLVPMDVFEGEPVKIDLVYADAGHKQNIFKIAAYDKKARLILHKDLARIVLLVARNLYKNHGWVLVLKDGLRPVEAQQRLVETDIVKANPHWLQEPRLLSGPGQGAHPRGMAADVSCEDKNGTPVDMGTVFDEMTAQSARAYDGFEPHILNNRKILEGAFMNTAETLSLPMLPIPSEWWDFRFPGTHSGLFAPITDAELPPGLKICSAPAKGDFEQLAKSILMSI